MAATLAGATVGVSSGRRVTAKSGAKLCQVVSRGVAITASVFGSAHKDNTVGSSRFIRPGNQGEPLFWHYFTSSSWHYFKFREHPCKIVD
jgi:hypothetical protein